MPKPVGPDPCTARYLDAEQEKRTERARANLRVNDPIDYGDEALDAFIHAAPTPVEDERAARRGSLQNLDAEAAKDHARRVDGRACCCRAAPRLAGQIELINRRPL